MQKQRKKEMKTIMGVLIMGVSLFVSDMALAQDSNKGQETKERVDYSDAIPALTKEAEKGRLESQYVLGSIVKRRAIMVHRSGCVSQL